MCKEFIFSDICVIFSRIILMIILICEEITFLSAANWVSSFCREANLSIHFFSFSSKSSHSLFLSSWISFKEQNISITFTPTCIRSGYHSPIQLFLKIIINWFLSNSLFNFCPLSRLRYKKLTTHPQTSSTQPKTLQINKGKIAFLTQPYILHILQTWLALLDIE